MCFKFQLIMFKWSEIDQQKYVHFNCSYDKFVFFQLCNRGRVHVFKYLEIQAIKEDRKRGVLTDNEYRRSYRKTGQLNDFRFANGFNADARRKRHTADSGYGSEQPLDRRWSQEFSQDVSSDVSLSDLRNESSIN